MRKLITFTKQPRGTVKFSKTIQGACVMSLLFVGSLICVNANSSFALPANTLQLASVSNKTTSPNVSVSDTTTLPEAALQMESTVNQERHQLGILSNSLASQPQLRSQLKVLSDQIARLQTQLDQLVRRINVLEANARLARNPTPVEQDTVEADTSSGKVSTTNNVTGSNKTASGQEKYNDAFKAIDTNDYAKARTLLSDFVAQYPKSRLLPDAHYWLGELYLVNNQPDKAAQNFKAVFTLAPKNDKAADAMRKLAAILMANGDNAHAKELYSRVVKNYPHTPAALLAAKMLKSMQ